MMRRDFSRKRTICSTPVFAATLIVCILCWVTGYYYALGFPLQLSDSDTSLWKEVCRNLPNKESAYVIGFLLMLGGAFLLHRANYALGIIREKTLLPFLFYVLFISTSSGFFPLKPYSLGVFCLILAVYELFSSYHNADSRGRAFNSGFYLGVGSLLWIHILWFVPLFWIGMYRLRSFSGRTFLSSIFGVLAVYWFLLGWCAWQKDFSPFITSFTELANIHFSISNDTNWIEWTSMACTAVLAIIASFNIFSHEYDDNLRTRQFLYFLIMASFWAFVLVFAYEGNSAEFMGMAYVPAAILSAHFFTISRGKIIPWAFYSTLIVYFTLISIQLWQNL